jgi:hypothetical protein
VALPTDVAPPPSWDPRVVGLVRFVEDERGLRFRHPVHIDFLPDDEFVAQLGDDEEAEDGSSEAAVGALRAFGLVHGELDLEEAGQRIVDDGVLGFYSWEDRRIRVRGTEVDDDVEAVLVHELTHALQDQVFDLAAMHEATTTSGEEVGLDALVEGDATRIELAYTSAQARFAPVGDRIGAPDEEPTTAHPSTDGGADAVAASEADEPGGDAELGALSGNPAIDLFTFVPYVVGNTFVELLAHRGGNRAVDDAFGAPPTSEQQLLHPQLYLDDVQPYEVPVPALREGEVALALDDDPSDDTTDVGALSWYAALAGRIDHRVAWEASRLWAGDASVLFTAGGRTCVRAAVATTTPEQIHRLGEIFQLWVDAAPSASGEVVVAPASVTVTSCDPGVAGPAAPEGYADTLMMAIYAAVLAAQTTAIDVPHEVGVCIVDEFVATVPAGEADALIEGGGDGASDLGERLGAACAHLG